MKCRAAILVEQHKALVVDDVEVPEPGFGQVLVKVLCSGVCGSQIGEIDGVKGEDRFLPHLLGHEGTGIVRQCGPGVTTVEEGDRVVLHWRPGQGCQGLPPRYHNATLGVVNAGWVTTFNELAVVSESRVTRVPGDLDPEVAALMGCAMTTGFGVVNNDARLKIGESIVVFGAGGIGLLIVQAAALVSAHPIIAVDLHDDKLALAARLGATHRLNALQTDVESSVREIVGPEGVDVAVDNTGKVKVIEAAYRVTGVAGRTVLVGVPPKGEAARIYTLPLHFEKVLTGSHGGESRPDVDIPRYVRLCQSGRLDFKQIITARYDLVQINEAISDMREGKVAGRCLIRM